MVGPQDPGLDVVCARVEILTNESYQSTSKVTQSPMVVSLKMMKKVVFNLEISKRCKS